MVWYGVAWRGVVRCGVATHYVVLAWRQVDIRVQGPHLMQRSRADLWIHDSAGSEQRAHTLRRPSSSSHAKRGRPLLHGTVDRSASCHEESYARGLAVLGRGEEGGAAINGGQIDVSSLLGGRRISPQLSAAQNSLPPQHQAR